MTRNVNVRFRSFLPGAGYDSAGQPKQGKTNVRGRVNVTSYARGGEALAPRDIGLAVIDDLRLTLVDPVRSSDVTNQQRDVVYSDAAEQFYVLEHLHDFHQFYLGGSHTGGYGGQNPYRVGGWQEIAGATVLTVSFDAQGDSAHDIELS